MLFNCCCAINFRFKHFKNAKNRLDLCKGIVHFILLQNVKERWPLCLPIFFWVPQKTDSFVMKQTICPIESHFIVLNAQLLILNPRSRSNISAVWNNLSTDLLTDISSWQLFFLLAHCFYVLPGYPGVPSEEPSCECSSFSVFNQRKTSHCHSLSQPTGTSERRAREELSLACTAAADWDMNTEPLTEKFLGSSGPLRC